MKNIIIFAEHCTSAGSVCTDLRSQADENGEYSDDVMVFDEPEDELMDIAMNLWVSNKSFDRQCALSIWNELITPGGWDSGPYYTPVGIADQLLRALGREDEEYGGTHWGGFAY